MAANNWNLIDSNVKILIEVGQYNVQSDNRLLIPFVRHDWRQDKVGLLDRSGNIVVKAIYDHIFDSCFDESDLLRVGVRYSKNFGSEANPKLYYYYHIGLINTKGDVILPLEYSRIVSSTDKSLYTIERDGKHGVVNKDAEQVIPFGVFDWIDGFHKGYARVYNYVDEDGEKVKKWGVVNTSGKIVVPIAYSNIWNFYDRDFSSIVVEIDKKQDYIPFASFSESAGQSYSSSYDDSSDADYFRIEDCYDYEGNFDTERLEDAILSGEYVPEDW